MTLVEFSASRHALVGVEMANFLEKYDPSIYETGFPFNTIYVYDESYWIEDYGNGNFHLHIETHEHEGTLLAMEEILYKWAYGDPDRSTNHQERRQESHR